KAAITGTESCTVAARPAVSPLSAAYHTTYPSPEVTAPDVTASASPAGVAWKALANTTLTSSIGGEVYKKLYAVARKGSPGPRPSREYPPQAMPATVMSAAPNGSGASSPGITR